MKEEIQEQTVSQMWNGYCPESWLQGKTVRMKLNRDDFYESEETGLQICVFSGVQAVVMNFRGNGKFHSSNTFADEIENGELLSPQNIDRFPFNNGEVFAGNDEIKEFLETIN